MRRASITLAAVTLIAGAGLNATTTSVSAVAASGIPNRFAAAIAFDTVNHAVTLPAFEGEAPGVATPGSS